MSVLTRARIALDALHRFGFTPLARVVIYRLSLLTPIWRWRTPIHAYHSGDGLSENNAVLPEMDCDEIRALLMDDREDILQEGEEILGGKVRLFGGVPVELDLCPPHNQLHWSTVGENDSAWEDIKLVWEPARMGWAYRLGRAYMLTRNEQFADFCWQKVERFLEANPPNRGPNWTSGQEVALRILVMTFILRSFRLSPASTPIRRKRVLGAIYDHAMRIPPTLIYAQSQNNNHLLVEAAALYTAGILLKGDPQAAKWKRLGWHHFHHAVQVQFDPDGTYIQQSSNYHRLALQTSLWVWALAKRHGELFPETSLSRLKAATRWLWSQMDPISGRATNLGHNDGSYILPLAAGGFADMRPVIQAAGAAFLNEPLLPCGAWDEFGLWLAIQNQKDENFRRAENSPTVLRLGDHSAWGTLRAVHFKGRPAHADQLHVDLWWQGINLACDPGTYRYTAPAPWQNSLMNTSVHNTIEIDGQDQMRRSGRFLWTQWAQAVCSHYSSEKITAQHDGYRRLGIIHQRTLQRLSPIHWRVMDDLIPSYPPSKLRHLAVLHWLLPEWPWKCEDGELHLITPFGGEVRLSVQGIDPRSPETKPGGTIQIIRAGEVVFGENGIFPTLGWISPTYNDKKPALSLRYSFEFLPPLRLSSDWFFPHPDEMSHSAGERFG